MMAVDSKQGSNGSNENQATPAAAGHGKFPRRKRGSALQKAAGSLPSVETSLDEFIARANSTLVDAANWDKAEKEARAQDLQQREADQQRWKAAEGQLHESEVREQSLRRQLDGLQGRLAEAEARAAVAGSSGSSQELALQGLKAQTSRAEERARTAEAKAEQLAADLALAASRPSLSAPQAFHDEDADERAKIAEAKAAKAIAAAKAAAAGLNVSSEIAAIESGLVVPAHGPRKSSNALVYAFAALAIGAAAMFAVNKLVLNKDEQATAAPAPAAQVAPAQPAAAPAQAPAPAPAAAPSKPTVTPIEEPAPAPSIEPPAKQAEPAPAPAPAPAPPPAHHAPAPAHHAAPAPAPAPKKQPAPGLADPFAGSAPAPAPKKQPAAKAPEKKPAAGGIVDPF
jgi:hypothetical protein